MFKLCWTITYSVFNGYWLCFNFYICFINFVPVGITNSAVGIKTCANQYRNQNVEVNYQEKE